MTIVKEQTPQIFNFNEAPLTVSMDENDNPLFLAKDVAELLGYGTASDAVKYLDEDEKLIRQLVVSGQLREVNMITESGLYSLVLRSRKPEAKTFKKWLTSEVLPAIRKHGVYATESFTDKAIADPEFGIKALLALKEEREARKLAEKWNETLTETVQLQEKTITQQAPMVKNYKAIMDADGLYTVEKISKDLGMTAHKLNLELEKRKIQYKRGGLWMPRAPYDKEGYTKTRTHPYTRADGSTGSNLLTCWTEKGREFIFSIFKVLQ